MGAPLRRAGALGGGGADAERRGERDAEGEPEPECEPEGEAPPPGDALPAPATEEGVASMEVPKVRVEIGDAEWVEGAEGVAARVTEGAGEREGEADAEGEAVAVREGGAEREGGGRPDSHGVVVPPSPPAVAEGEGVGVG